MGVEWGDRKRKPPVFLYEMEAIAFAVMAITVAVLIVVLVVAG